MHYYYHFGLTIKSDLYFPELESRNMSLDASLDASIRQGVIATHGVSEATPLSPFLQANSTQIWLKIPSIAHFIIQNGREIIYDPVSDVDEDSIRTFILGACTGALLHQRGFVTLRGTAFGIDDKCLIYMGKVESALKIAMVQRGYRLISDGICAIDDKGNAMPSIPRIKLWQDDVNKLNIDTKPLTLVRPSLNKFNYFLHHSFSNKALPVKAAYILHTHSQSNIKQHTVAGINKFPPIKNHTYRFEYIEGMGLIKQHFKRYVQFSASIHLSQIYFQKHYSPINDLIDCLLSDLTKQEPYWNG